MRFSLIRVTKQTGCKVNGVWIQDHCGGTIETATVKARQTEQVNSNAITIAVVADVGPGWMPPGIEVFDRTRLDMQ